MKKIQFRKVSLPEGEAFVSPLFEGTTHAQAFKAERTKRGLSVPRNLVVLYAEDESKHEPIPSSDSPVFRVDHRGINPEKAAKAFVAFLHRHREEGLKKPQKL